jgi:hypothetical protein
MIGGARAVLAVKVCGGAIATTLAAVLCMAFWPQVKPDRISARSAVEQPVFMVSSAPKPAPQLAALTATPVSLPPSVEKVGFDKLAAALKTDFGPNAASSPAPPANAEAARLCVRGLIALANGDIAAARLWLARAADAGDPRALVALGDAFNPVMLAHLGVLGAPGDPLVARDYYNRAVAAGLTGARDRLASLATGAD